MIILTLMSCREKEFTPFDSGEANYAIHHQNVFLIRSLNTNALSLICAITLIEACGDKTSNRDSHADLIGEWNYVN